MSSRTIAPARNEQGEIEFGNYLRKLARARLPETFEATDLLESVKTLEEIERFGEPVRVVDKIIHVQAHRSEQHVVAYAYAIEALPEPDLIVLLNAFPEWEMAEGLDRAEELARFVFREDTS